MTVTIARETESRLREEAERTGQDVDALADALLLEALAQASRDYEETCAAIAEGLADLEAGRTVSFEEARAAWEAQKVVRREKVSAAA